MAQRLISVWQPFFLAGDSRTAVVDAARELEALGYSRIWASAGFGSQVPPRFREILDGTTTIGVATGSPAFGMCPLTTPSPSLTLRHAITPADSSSAWERAMPRSWRAAELTTASRTRRWSRQVRPARPRSPLSPVLEVRSEGSGGQFTDRALANLLGSALGIGADLGCLVVLLIPGKQIHQHRA